MMKHYIYNKVCAIALAGLALTACSDDFLDKSPNERVEITTVDQVIQLLSTAYMTGNYGWICEISSDNIVDINAPYMATQSNGSEVLVRYNLNSYDRMDDELYKFEPVRSSTGSDSPSEVWEGCYNAIATANHAIALLDEFKAANNGEETDQMRAAYGEAYLTRAYHHFILVNIFSQAYKNEEASRQDAGIPYCTDPEDKVMVDYPRGSVTETYQKIEKDLLAGLDRVNDVIYQMPKWHFNRNAAHAFAARFYLYKRDYEKVIEHANAVLGTDRDALPTMLMDYSRFDEATRSTDYAEIWQGPKEPNNLLLIATYSRQWRRSVGYRYATAGRALRDIMFHLGPNWRWYLMPCAGVGGETFWDGTNDHGYMSSRIAERFEYSDKVAGIGYAHVIRRELTCNELLLNRAEAYLLGRHDVKEALADMLAFDNSRWSFSESNKAFYTEGGALSELTEAKLLSWYKPTESNVKNHSNTLADWNFTQNMSADFIITEDLVPYMNCLNDMRRYYTAWTGLRFFDVKRWGYEYEHHYGPDDEVFKLEWNSPNRAIEVPQEVIGAGMETSRPQVAKQGGDSFSKSTDAVMKEQ